VRVVQSSLGQGEVAPHRNGLTNDGLGYGELGSEIENDNGSHTGFSNRVDVQQAAEE